MAKTRVKVLTITIHDCEVQAIRGSGHGGQKLQKTSSAIRVMHRPSGASGVSKDGRSQIHNKRSAFRKMAESKEFQAWVKVQVGKDLLTGPVFDGTITPTNTKVEVKRNGIWVNEAGI